MQARARDRLVDLTIGYVSLGLFCGSIAVLIWFLLDGINRPQAPGAALSWIERTTQGRGDARATFDAFLILSWGLLHSLLARPRFKIHLQKYVRPHLEPALYAIVASAGLVALCLLYLPIRREVYALSGGAALFVRLLFYGAWALFLYCWFHLDLLEVVGLRPILRYLDGEARPHEPFRPSGPFLWVRHPVELAFLVAFWATPRMTTGHLLFASLMTLYTFLGIDLEERKMLEIDGPGYQEYIKKVPQIIPLPR
jgi:protein-S-isoprenylcysteine O-methyltransferase Ste14